MARIYNDGGISKEGRRTVCSECTVRRYLDNDEDRCAYAEVIGDYFAESGDETEVDTEYEDIDGMCQL